MSCSPPTYSSSPHPPQTLYSCLKLVVWKPVVRERQFVEWRTLLILRIALQVLHDLPHEQADQACHRGAPAAPTPAVRQLGGDDVTRWDFEGSTSGPDLPDQRDWHHVKPLVGETRIIWSTRSWKKSLVMITAIAPPCVSFPQKVITVLVIDDDDDSI